MDSSPNSHNQNSSDISSDSKKSSNNKKQLISENNENNLDKETLNLFKGIVKITRINSAKINKSPIMKYKSVKNTENISTFIDKIYNNEEHLNNNRISTINNLENISQKNSTMSPRRTRLKIKKSLFSINKEGNSPKKSKKGNALNNNNKGENTTKYKSNKNYSFFFKLKEKNKIPSKTPYLDKKAWKSTYNLNLYNLEENANANDINDKIDNKNINMNKISDKTFFDEIKIKKNNSNNINIKYNEEEKNNSIKKSEKKLEISKGEENKNNIIIYKDINNNKKLDTDNNNDIIINNKKKKISLNENNKEKKCTNNLIINILNRPFLCCLKS